MEQKLTKNEEVFVTKYLETNDKLQAYITAWPANVQTKRANLIVYANRVLRKPHIKKRYEELLDEFREREKVKIGWTREQAMEQLQFVVNANRKEIERIEEANEEQLEYILEKIQDSIDPKKTEELIEQMLSVKRRGRVKATNNMGILDAVTELNRMQGFSEENLNVNAAITFAGEEDLED